MKTSEFFHFPQTWQQLVNNNWFTAYFCKFYIFDYENEKNNLGMWVFGEL
jgi:hypothetical protein